MTKINVAVNPFTMVAKISARIDGREERTEVIFSPYEFGLTWYPFILGNKEYEIMLSYDEELMVEIAEVDELGNESSVAVKFEIVKK